MNIFMTSILTIIYRLSDVLNICKYTSEGLSNLRQSQPSMPSMKFIKAINQYLSVAVIKPKLAVCFEDLAYVTDLTSKSNCENSKIGAETSSTIINIHIILITRDHHSLSQVKVVSQF